MENHLKSFLPAYMSSLPEGVKWYIENTNLHTHTHTPTHTRSLSLSLSLSSNLMVHHYTQDKIQGSQHDL